MDRYARQLLLEHLGEALRLTDETITFYNWHAFAFAYKNWMRYWPPKPRVPYVVEYLRPGSPYSLAMLSGGPPPYPMGLAENAAAFLRYARERGLQR